MAQLYFMVAYGSQTEFKKPETLAIRISVTPDPSLASKESCTVLLAVVSDPPFIKIPVPFPKAKPTGVDAEADETVEKVSGTLKVLLLEDQSLTHPVETSVYEPEEREADGIKTNVEAETGNDHTPATVALEVFFSANAPVEEARRLSEKVNDTLPVLTETVCVPRLEAATPFADISCGLAPSAKAMDAVLMVLPINVPPMAGKLAELSTSSVKPSIKSDPLAVYEPTVTPFTVTPDKSLDNTHPVEKCKSYASIYPS